MPRRFKAGRRTGYQAMTTSLPTIRTLLFATAILGFASPAMAGSDYQRWQYRYADAPWSWVCGAFEARHRCNAEFTLRRNRCGCIER
jgi:hypothetical protein